ncbi:MAG TPA: sigma-70 family RNA polymerase sigma factor [Chloroflexota bacterium]
MVLSWFRRVAGSTSGQWTQEEAARFEEEALAHLDELYRTALRMTRRSQDAEDLVQECYMKAFKFADRFEQGTDLRAWLFKILTNSYLNRYRKASREPESTSIDATGEYFIYEQLGGSTQHVLSPSAEDEALSELMDSDVKQALEDLPEQYRLVILLRDVEGFSYKEIAGMAGIPVGTVMSRISRGRKLLQRSLWRHAVEAGYIKGGGPRDADG